MFFVADIAYAEAEEHIGQLTEQRGGDVDVALRTLRSIVALGAVAEHNLYEIYEIEARKRLGARDPEDWPTLAAALALSCPIWTEDTDFFGCGVATWTCQNIELYLEQ